VIAGFRLGSVFPCHSRLHARAGSVGRRSANGDSVRTAVRELFVEDIREAFGSPDQKHQRCIAAYRQPRRYRVVAPTCLRRDTDVTATARVSEFDAKKDTPFAEFVDSLPRMAESGRTRSFRKRRVKPYRGRGDVYCWLRAHHAQVAARLATEELSWATLAEALSREGLRGRNGVELTGRAVAQVWRRVSRDVEAEDAARTAAPPKRKFPSRISPDWRPRVVSPAQPPAGQDTSNAPYDPDEQLARIRRIIAERSGRKA